MTDLTFNWGNRGGHEIGEIFTIVVYFSNKTLRNLCDIKISSPDTDYNAGDVQFISIVSAQSERSVTLTLRPWSNKSHLHLPSTFKVVASNSFGVLSSINCNVNIGYFSNYLKKMQVSSNMLVIGLQGAGKSSFINSIVKTLKMDPRRTVAPPSAGKVAGTVMIRKFHLSDFSFSLIDTPGLTPLNYKSEVMISILNGSATVNWCLNKAENGWDTTSGKTIEKPTLAIVLIPYDSIEDDFVMSPIKNFLGLCRNLSVQALVIVTKLDKLDNNLKGESFVSANRNQTVLTTKTSLAKKLASCNIDETKILHIINYEEAATELNFELDKQIYDILWRACQQSQYSTDGYQFI